MNEISHPVVLTLSGHDPSGGAGIHADIEAIRANACHAVSAITALTVQDTCNISKVITIAPDTVEQQARTVLADFTLAAIKIGLTGSVQNVNMISALLSEYHNIPVVFDPVLTAGGGFDLTMSSMLHSVRDKLLPLCSIITPNSIEARRLAEENDLGLAAERLLMLGCNSVLITGTHESEEKVKNRLYRKKRAVVVSEWPRLPESFHGSGCTLASAIAALLARGLHLEDAVAQAQHYTWHTLSQGYRPGKGQTLPNRLYKINAD